MLQKTLFWQRRLSKTKHLLLASCKNTFSNLATEPRTIKAQAAVTHNLSPLPLPICNFATCLKALENSWTDQFEDVTQTPVFQTK